MRYFYVTLKECNPLTTPREAIAWASNFVRQARPATQSDSLPVRVGPHFFLSRPAGVLSVHGYARQRCSAISLTKRLDRNPAIIEFLHEHCWAQLVSGKTIMGTAVVLTLNPLVATRRIRGSLDLDQLLLRVIDATLVYVARLFFGGQGLACLAGIQHQARLHGNAKLMRQRKQDDERAERPLHPEIFVHLLLLPEATDGRPVNLVTHPEPGQSSAPVDLRKDFLETFVAKLEGQMYNHIDEPAPRFDAAWEALIREACSRALWHVSQATSVKDPAERRRFALTKFEEDIRLLDATELKRRHALRHRQFAEFCEADRRHLQKTVVDDFPVIKANFRRSRARRLEHIAPLLSSFITPPQALEIRCVDVPGNKALLVSQRASLAPVRPTFPSSRAAIIDQSLNELETIRRGSQLAALAHMCTIEIKLRALSQSQQEPPWIKHLADIAAMVLPPHQEILEGTPE